MTFKTLTCPAIGCTCFCFVDATGDTIPCFFAVVLSNFNDRQHTATWYANCYACDQAVSLATHGAVDSKTGEGYWETVVAELQAGKPT